MREYELYEYAKEKCPICGCRNKVYTPVYDDLPCNCNRCKCGERESNRVGFQLKCCNCGFIRVYRTDHLRNGMPRLKDDDLVRGMDVCFQPSPCNKKDCPLYGTCPDFWNTYGKHAYDWKTLPSTDGTSSSNSSTHDGVESNRVLIEVVEPEKFR